MLVSCSQTVKYVFSPFATCSFWVTFLFQLRMSSYDDLRSVRAWMCVHSWCVNGMHVDVDVSVEAVFNQMLCCISWKNQNCQAPLLVKGSMHRMHYSMLRCRLGCCLQAFLVVWHIVIIVYRFHVVLFINYYFCDMFFSSCILSLLGPEP